MSRRTAAWLAWSVWAVCVVLITLTLVLDFTTEEFLSKWVDSDTILASPYSRGCCRWRTRRLAR